MAGSLDSDLYDGEHHPCSASAETHVAVDLYGDNDDNREEPAQQGKTENHTEQRPATSQAKLTGVGVRIQNHKPKQTRTERARLS